VTRVLLAHIFLRFDKKKINADEVGDMAMAQTEVMALRALISPTSAAMPWRWSVKHPYGRGQIRGSPGAAMTRSCA